MSVSISERAKVQTKSDIVKNGFCVTAEILAVFLSPLIIQVNTKKDGKERIMSRGSGRLNVLSSALQMKVL